MGEYKQLVDPLMILHINICWKLCMLSMTKMASKRPLDCDSFDSFENPSKKFKTVNSPIRQFKEVWKSGNQWLRYDSQLKSMLCDLCIRAGKKNTFTTGCHIMKKENVSKHSSSKGRLS